MASSTQDNVNLAQGAPTIAVGQSLKAARELMGKSIEEVAEQLRIRQPFLQALEDGRHKDLPGGTYAIGFLRTYAEFLGLDGEEMVRRFRAEAASELNARSQLVFPSPVSEGRVPGGAVLFLGLLLAGVAYGGWYFLSASNSDVAEMVPPLPDRLASALNRPAAVTSDTAKPEETATKPEEAEQTASEPPAKGEDAAAAASTSAPAPAPATAAKEEVVPPEEEDEAKAPAVPATPAPATPAAAKVESPKQDPAKAEPAQTPQTTATPAPSAAPAPAAAPQAVPASATTAAPAEPATAPVAMPAVAPVPEGKVFGQEHTDSRIQLKASLDDCWVQVRELDGQLLLSRLLRRGDSYLVPNRPGLTLMVGNAGALEIIVDGKKTAPLGNPGQVRRDIKLDPDKLLPGG